MKNLIVELTWTLISVESFLGCFNSMLLHYSLYSKGKPECMTLHFDLAKAEYPEATQHVNGQCPRGFIQTADGRALLGRPK